MLRYSLWHTNETFPPTRATIVGWLFLALNFPASIAFSAFQPHHRIVFATGLVHAALAMTHGAYDLGHLFLVLAMVLDQQLLCFLRQRPHQLSVGHLVKLPDRMLEFLPINKHPKLLADQFKSSVRYVAVVGIFPDRIALSVENSLVGKCPFQVLPQHVQDPNAGYRCLFNDLGRHPL